MPATPKEPNPRAPQEFELTNFVVDSVFGMPIGFDLELDVTGKTKTIELPDDHFIITSPGMKVTLTNTTTGESFTTNITGSLHQEPLPDGGYIQHYVGRWLNFDPEIDDGQPGIVLTSGHFSATYDADDNLVVPLHGTGQIIDVIDLLM